MLKYAALFLFLSLALAADEYCVKTAPHPVRVGGDRTVNFDYSLPPHNAGRVSYDTSAPIQVDRAQLTIITSISGSAPVADTAKSVLAQSMQSFKWIIVHDQTADLEALNALSKTDDRIVLANCGEACGASMARNAGLKLVETPYVMFLDASDMMESVYAEQLLWFLEANAEFSYANTYSVKFGEKESLESNNFYDTSLEGNNQPVSAVIRISALKKASSAWPTVFDEGIASGEEWKLWLSLKAAGLHGATVPEHMLWQHSKAHAQGTEFVASAAKREFPELFREGHVNPTMEEACAECTQVRPAFMQGVEYINPKCGQSAIVVMPTTDSKALKLVQLLSAQKWQITVVCTSDTGGSPELDLVRAELQQYTEDIHVLPHFLRTENYGEFLLHMTRSRGADAVIVTESFSGYNLLPFLKAQAPHVALVDYVHTRQLSTKTAAFFDSAQVAVGGFSKMSAQFAQYLDASIFVSNDEMKWVSAQQQQFAEISEPKDPFFNPVFTTSDDRSAFGTPPRFVVYHGVNPDTEFPVPSESTKAVARAKFGVEDDELCIVFVGKLIADNRPMDALKALNNVVQDQKAHLVVIGSGHLMEDMYRFVADHGLWPHVTFLGNMQPSKIVSAMNAADVVLATSDTDALSPHLIQGMSMGIVPVAANVFGQKELVSADTGFLVEVDDVDAATDALVRLAENPSLLQKLSTNARAAVVNKFTSEKMSQGFVTALDAAIVHAQSTAKFVTPQVAEAAAAAMPRVAKFMSDNQKGTLVKRLNHHGQEELSHMIELFHRRTGNSTSNSTGGKGNGSPKTAKLKQVITFAITGGAAAYTGALKTIIEVAWGTSCGLWTKAAASTAGSVAGGWAADTTVESTAADARRASVKITIEATMPATAVNAAKALSAAITTTSMTSAMTAAQSDLAAVDSSGGYSAVTLPDVEDVATPTATGAPPTAAPTSTTSGASSITGQVSMLMVLAFGTVWTLFH